MSKTTVVRRSPEPTDAKQKGEGVNVRQLLDNLQKQLSFSESLVITTLPRGSLQIVQPGKLPETLIKDYARDYHLEDKLTWQTILNERPMTGSEIWPDGNGRFAREYLGTRGLKYSAAAPLAAPVLDGYPGAVHLYRTEQQGEFTEADLAKLADFARQLDDAIEKVRASRPKHAACLMDTHLTPRPKVRQFLFDGQLRELFTRGEFDTLDSRLKEEMLHTARQELHRLNGELALADRAKLPDSRGDLWTFRVVVYRAYPAVGEGPFVLFCIQPSCGDWSTVRPSDFQADEEIARLIPALKFMKQEFRRGPTLGEIAKTAHLSPFHFHRRFTELLGLTPKHYLLECQIQDAKAQLLARKKDLAQIAADCGFAHQSHFTSRFKQATGLTPTKWRKVALEAKSQPNT
ncbi:MAG TPA: AraC family transcriptional regulator [Tepidisphaeraceae bacterium]